LAVGVECGTYDCSAHLAPPTANHDAHALETLSAVRVSSVVKYLHAVSLYSGPARQCSEHRTRRSLFTHRIVTSTWKLRWVPTDLGAWKIAKRTDRKSDSRHLLVSFE
jgi:hypothetical protein